MLLPADAGEADVAFEQLRWCLTALASGAADQMALYPDFAADPEQFVAEFDDACRVAAARAALVVPTTAWDALLAVDIGLAEMSRHGRRFREGLWTREGLVTAAEWNAIRALAADALEAFGWGRDE